MFALFFNISFSQLPCVLSRHRHTVHVFNFCPKYWIPRQQLWQKATWQHLQFIWNNPHSLLKNPKAQLLIADKKPGRFPFLQWVTPYFPSCSLLLSFDSCSFSNFLVSRVLFSFCDLSVQSISINWYVGLCFQNVFSERIEGRAQSSKLN